MADIGAYVLLHLGPTLSSDTVIMYVTWVVTANNTNVFKTDLIDIGSIFDRKLTEVVVVVVNFSV